MKRIKYYIFAMVLFMPVFIYADTINVELSCPDKITFFEW